MDIHGYPNSFCSGSWLKQSMSRLQSTPKVEKVFLWFMYQSFAYIPVSAKSMFQEATNAVRCLTISAPGLFLPAETRKFGEKRTMETTIHRCGNVRFGGFKHYHRHILVTNATLELWPTSTQDYPIEWFPWASTNSGFASQSKATKSGG